LKAKLDNTCSVSGAVKLGTTINTLTSKAKDCVDSLATSDVIALYGHVNGVSQNNSGNGLKWIVSFVKQHNRTHIIL
jgi:hypothetical protein